MAELENSSNNQLPPPSPPASIIATSWVAPASSGGQTSVQPHLRDSKYYYADGSVVFLVENRLFKIHASLLAADAEEYEFKSIMKDATENLGSEERLGTNDAHPIVLPPDVTKSQFRDFLMVVFGGVTSYSFLSLLKTLQTPSDYNPRLASRLANIGYLGCRFGIKRLDTWSQSHLCTILRRFVATQRLTDDWDAQTFLRLVQYVQNTTATSYRIVLSSLMRHIMSALVKKAYELDDEMPHGNIIDICAALYKEKDLLINTPGIFGFVFAVIVSLGPHSPIWTDRLTREDRRVLYAANATLIRLSNLPDLEIGWITDPSAIKVVCSQCSRNFDDIWEDAFSQCNGLKSRIPSEDVRHVVCLPAYHVYFRSISNADCQCSDQISIHLSQKTEALFHGLTEKYKYLVETV
ncbi:unnamed protein product [Rhizoctonia solani]|uniref:BTB domain-containing protein n=1 Tax=Rhizoctonia solani TaxID=456999 RepID=A0A8H3DVP9_9AGAM|nr:unnamed protein product [Rhizoctonia solani]